MTVIAWDGKTLAADKMRCEGTLIRTITKIFKKDDCLAGISGDVTRGLTLCKWYFSGAIDSMFPAPQSCEGDATLLIIRRNETSLLFENSPIPIVIEDETYCIGSGRDYATAAIYLGKSAVDAVRVAIDLDSSCGIGIDSLTFD